MAPPFMILAHTIHIQGLEPWKFELRDITRNEEENEKLHEIFRVVSRFPHYIRVIFRKSITFGSHTYCIHQ